MKVLVINLHNPDSNFKVLAPSVIHFTMTDDRILLEGIFVKYFWQIYDLYMEIFGI